MEFLFLLVMGFGVPPLIDRAIKRGHFEWLESWFREAWAVLLCFLTVYFLSRNEVLTLTKTLHAFWKAHPYAGYFIFSVLGAVLFCGYWWLTGKLSIPGEGSSNSGTQQKIEIPLPRSATPPVSFFQVVAVKILTKTILADSPISMNVGFKVVGSQPIHDMYFAQSIITISYDDEKRDPKGERTVRTTFEGVIREQEEEIARQRLPGQGVGLNQLVYRTVDSGPLSQKQVDGILTGNTRLYLLTWTIWKDASENAGKTTTCQWLQAPPSLDLSKHEAVWQMCVF